jgi:hypothetical protein
MDSKLRARRTRLIYLIGASLVVALGLGTRRFGSYLPVFVAEYGGDTLWALMVFLGLGVLAPGTKMSRRAAIALAASYAVEISQLYHAAWLDSLRHTRLGGLILGFGFLWSDIVCYTVGVTLGALAENLLRSVSGNLES